MKYRSLKCNFHDGELLGFTLGPDHELTLEVAPWQGKPVPVAFVHFGGIANFDEVASYFRALPPPRKPGASIDGIVGIQYVGEGPNWVVVDLDRHSSIVVQAHHVDEY